MPILVDELYIALGLAMYREEIQDFSSGIPDHVPGVNITTNIGELDYQAEMLIRGIWAKVGREEQRELLKKAAEMAQERSIKQEEARLRGKAAFEAEKKNASETN